MPFLICDRSSESWPNSIAGAASVGRGQSAYSVTFQSGNNRSHSACSRSHASFNSANPVRQRSASDSHSRSCSARSFAEPAVCTPCDSQRRADRAAASPTQVHPNASSWPHPTCCPTRSATEPAAAETSAPRAQFRLHSNSRARRPSRGHASRPRRFARRDSVTNACGLTLPTLPRRLQRDAQGVSRIGQQLLNLLKLPATLTTSNRPKPEKQSSRSPRLRSQGWQQSKANSSDPSRSQQGTAATTHNRKKTPNGHPPSKNRGSFWSCNASAASRTAVVRSFARCDRLFDGVA